MDEQDTTTPKITRPELSRRGSLTADEINTVFRVVKAHEQFPQGAFFPIVSLAEPPKREVQAWLPLIGDVIQAAEHDCVLPVVLRLPLVAPSTDATTSRRVGSAAWPTSSRGVAHRRLGPQA